MKLVYILFFLCFSLMYLSCSNDSMNDDESIDDNTIENSNVNSLYFPPLTSNTWETASLNQLNWQENKAQDLYQYLDAKDSKGFMVLYNGRIVIEKYFNGHSQNDAWFWNSAAKSLTGALVGVAHDKELIDINNKTSDYLGNDWSSLSSDKQDLISIKHHLSMNTGLDEKINQPIAWTCTLSTCLDYSADAEERWAYHQGAFSLLFTIIEEATNENFAVYSKARIESKIGMKGSWVEQGFLRRYQSDTRSMARFGLLMMNSGMWNEEVLLSQNYFDAMINSSQDINLSYGYLWWLNGKGNFMGTGSQEVFAGSLIPNAPNDMFSALGANDQKIYVVPSKKLVIVRTGDSAGEAQLGPSSFDNELWEKINEVID